jgi:hypothetical protein
MFAIKPLGVWSSLKRNKKVIKYILFAQVWHDSVFKL